MTKTFYAVSSVRAMVLHIHGSWSDMRGICGVRASVIPSTLQMVNGDVCRNCQRIFDETEGA